MYAITTGIPKPASVKKKQPGATKYPLAEMEVNQSFVVPYGDMNEGETPEAFRNRIYKSARNYALRDYNERKAEPNAADVTKKDFSCALMEADDAGEEKRYVAGDVVVWRDA